MNFYKRFGEKILDGRKIHTLRRGRFEVGEALTITADNEVIAVGKVSFVIDKFMNVRHTGFEKTPSINSKKIVEYTQALLKLHPGRYAEEFIDVLNLGSIPELFVKNDGFGSIRDFLTFCKEKLKEGDYQLIFWDIEGIK